MYLTPDTCTSPHVYSIVETVSRQLKLLAGAPSVQMADMPDSFLKVGWGSCWCSCCLCW